MPYLFLLLFSWLFVSTALGQKLYTISEAVSEARANNPVLKAEKYSIKIASSAITTASLRPNPIFNNQNIQLLNNQYFAPNTGLFNSQNGQQWFQLTKPLLLGQLRAKRTAFAREGLSYTNYAYNELNRTISYDVALKWMDIWLLKSNLFIFKEAKENVDTLVLINENRLKNQVITPIELIRTQLLSDQYSLQLKTYYNQYANELRNLKYMIASTDSIDINEKINLVSFTYLENKDTLNTLALERRSDMAVAKSAIAINKKNIDVQKALSLPYLEGGFLFNPQNNVPYAGTYITVSLPVYDRNQGERERAMHQLKQSEEYANARELQIITEVTNAYNSYLVSKKNLEEFQTIVKQSSRVLNTVRYSYLKGNTTLIDFLDAQRSYLETQKLYNEAIYNYRKSYIDILFTTGLISEY